MFEEEISPEEMFRQFFGGGMGGMGGPFGSFPSSNPTGYRIYKNTDRSQGGIFDTGPGFVFNMGGPGVRVHQFGGGRPRRRPHNHEQQPEGPTSLLRGITSLLPIILIFVLPLISSLFDGLMGGSGSSRFPTVRFDRAHSPQTFRRVSEGLQVPYWVAPSEVQSYTAEKWSEFDKSVENTYVNNLDYRCQNEKQRQQAMFYDARGIFFTDYKKLAEATNMEMPACRTLDELRLKGWR